jgi:uncharacterized protein YndB with AHSA1/START domain
MLIDILIVLVAIAAIFIAVVAMRPTDFGVTRSGTIAAPPAVVFPYINDYHNWEKWSPWYRMDPTSKITYEGAAAGLGAKYAWAGNAKVGQGRMEITESRPNELIRMRLEFIKPMAATNTTDFTFEAVGGQTTITWSMAGKNNFVGKAMHLMVNFDKIVGGQFEQGLANMNEVIQAANKR